MGEYELTQAQFGARDFSESIDVDNTAVPGIQILASSPYLERRVTDFTIHNTDGVNPATIAFYNQAGKRKYTITLTADEVAVITLKSAIVWRRNEDIYARTTSANVAEITISGKESQPWGL